MKHHPDLSVQPCEVSVSDSENDSNLLFLLELTMTDVLQSITQSIQATAHTVHEDCGPNTHFLHQCDSQVSAPYVLILLLSE